MSRHLEKAASVLLRHVDTRSDMASDAAFRARVVEQLSRPPRASRTRLAALVLVPVALSLIVLFIVLRRPGSANNITFAVGSQQAPGVVGSYLVPVGEASMPLRFSDGSVVTLAKSARARVSTTTAHGAMLLLETGQARCEIVPRPGAAWGVTAGPYIVEVKGTSFDVAWNTATSTLELQMRQGVVTLRGPGVEAGIELRDTQRFVSRPNVLVDAPPSSPTAIASEIVVSSGGLSMDAAIETPLDRFGSAPSASAPAPASSSAAAPPIESSAPASPVAWAVLASRGEYPRIISEAEARGIDAVLASGSDSDLAALADAARFVGRMDIATRTLNATRTRFPGSSRAASAAYILGRMADDAGNVAGALSWYDRYLSEAPGGALAPEAMGRRILLLKKSGNAAAARQAAEVYLQRFPKGPYSGVAREMTSQ